MNWLKIIAAAAPSHTWVHPLPIPGPTHRYYVLMVGLAVAVLLASGFGSWVLFKGNHGADFSLWSLASLFSGALLGLLSFFAFICAMELSDDWIEATRKCRDMRLDPYPADLLRGQEMVALLNLSKRTNKDQLAGMYAIHLKLLEEGHEVGVAIVGLKENPEVAVILQSEGRILTHDGRTTKIFSKAKGSGHEVHLRSIDYRSGLRIDMERAAQPLLHEIKAAKQFVELDGLVHEMDVAPVTATARRL